MTWTAHKIISHCWYDMFSHLNKKEKNNTYFTKKGICDKSYTKHQTSPLSILDCSPSLVCWNFPSFSRSPLQYSVILCYRLHSSTRLYTIFCFSPLVLFSLVWYLAEETIETCWDHSRYSYYSLSSQQCYQQLLIFNQCLAHLFCLTVTWLQGLLSIIRQAFQVPLSLVAEL